MRNARSNDIWRKLFKRDDLPLQQIDIKFSNVVGLGSKEFSLKGPISLICGENGVGKSSLLWLVYRALCPVENVQGAHRTLPAKIDSGLIDSVIISLRGDDGDVRALKPADVYIELDDESDEIPVVFVDPTFQIPELVRTIRSDANFSDLLEGVEAQKLNDNDLSRICLLVGKSYSLVEIFEVENYAQYEVFPYFRVVLDGVGYGSENMGLGELSLLYMAWIFTAVRTPSIILLEEPETFVAPRSQRVLIDLIANFASEKKLFVVISSHSGIIAERMPNSHLNLITKGRPNVVIAPDPDAALLIERLGLINYKNAVILVEDESAKSLTRAILYHVDSRLAACCEISVAGSDSKISNAIKNMPKNGMKKFCLIGLYDGDCRGNPDVLSVKSDWPKLFLPGQDCPEMMLDRHIEKLGIEATAEELKCSLVEVETAFGGAQGKDHHDWVLEICRSLRMPVENFYDRLALSWVEYNRKEAEDLASEIKKALAAL